MVHPNAVIVESFAALKKLYNVIAVAEVSASFHFKGSLGDNNHTQRCVGPFRCTMRCLPIFHGKSERRSRAFIMGGKTFILRNSRWKWVVGAVPISTRK